MSESTQALFSRMLKSPRNAKYSPTLRKFALSLNFYSKKHIIMSGQNLRSKGEYNNNPTSRQFQYIMKKLLIHSEIKGSESANAVALDSTSILHCSSSSA